MSRRDEIEKMILMCNRRLRILERKSVAEGSNTPPNILMEINDVKSRIADLQVELGDSSQVDIELSPKIEKAYYATKKMLRELQQSLNSLSSEIQYLSPVAQGTGTRLIKQAKENFVELEKDWNATNLYSEAAEDTLKSLQSRLTATKSSLNILVLRYNHRRRLDLLREQVANQQLTLTGEQIQAALQPQLEQIQTQIDSIEEQNDISPHDRKMLTIYRRNLGLGSQIITGERPYAPLNILIESVDIELAIEEIDATLAQG